MKPTMRRLVVSLGGSLLATSQAFAQSTGKAGSPVADSGPDVDAGLTTAAMILIPVILLILVAIMQPWEWFKRPKPKRRAVRPAVKAVDAAPPERRPFFPPVDKPGS